LNSQPKEESKLPELREQNSFPLTPLPTPIHKLRVTITIRNVSIGQLGYLSGCAPAQLLQTCSLAEYEKLEKVLDFIATTEKISVINILLVLNPKHSRY